MLNESMHAHMNKCNGDISGLEKPGLGRHLGQHDLPHITQKAPAAEAAWEPSLVCLPPDGPSTQFVYGSARNPEKLYIYIVSLLFYFFLK